MSESYPFHSTRARRSSTAHAVVGDFEDHLRRDRGVREPRGQLAAATCFLDFLHARGKEIDAITKRDIDDFFVAQSAHYTKETVANLAGFLRLFVRFLPSRSLVNIDWAGSVPRPRVFVGKRDPRFLESREVQTVLARVDRTSTIGKRDYAIFTLLALYGLRAAEIAQLRLDDMGWRSQTLRVRHRKCGDALELPLVPQAARALSDYLVARGDGGDRGVFLSTAGVRGALRAKTVSILAGDAIKRAGVDVARRSHLFRYAAAQSLFRAERPITEIAAVLGHRDLRSTLGYLSFTVRPLREVALNDAEDLS